MQYAASNTPNFKLLDESRRNLVQAHWGVGMSALSSAYSRYRKDYGCLLLQVNRCSGPVKSLILARECSELSRQDGNCHNRFLFRGPATNVEIIQCILRGPRDGDLTNPNKGGFLQFLSITIVISAEAERYCVTRKWLLETLSHLEKKKKNIAEMMTITEKFSKIIKFILYGYGRSLSILKQY